MSLVGDTPFHDWAGGPLFLLPPCNFCLIFTEYMTSLMASLVKLLHLIGMVINTLCIVSHISIVDACQLWMKRQKHEDELTTIAVLSAAIWNSDYWMRVLSNNVNLLWHAADFGSQILYCSIHICSLFLYITLARSARFRLGYTNWHARFKTC